MIKITVAKILDECQAKAFKIINIEGMKPRENFGKLYYSKTYNLNKDFPYIDIDNKSNDIIIPYYNLPNLSVGAIVAEELFFECLEYIKKASERARACALEIEKLKETWKGEETYIL